MYVRLETNHNRAWQQRDRAPSHLLREMGNAEEAVPSCRVAAADPESRLTFVRHRRWLSWRELMTKWPGKGHADLMIQGAPFMRAPPDDDDDDSTRVLLYWVVVSISEWRLLPPDDEPEF